MSDRFPYLPNISARYSCVERILLKYNLPKLRKKQKPRLKPRHNLKSNQSQLLKNNRKRKKAKLKLKLKVNNKPQLKPNKTHRNPMNSN